MIGEVCWGGCRLRKAVVAGSALALVFVPVQTNRPVRKSKNVAEADFNLNDKPGNLPITP